MSLASTLPNEILTHIFQDLTEDFLPNLYFTLQPHTSSSSSSTAFSSISSSFRLPPPSPTSSGTQFQKLLSPLSRVCKGWRPAVLKLLLGNLSIERPGQIEGLLRAFGEVGGGDNDDSGSGGNGNGCWYEREDNLMDVDGGSGENGEEEEEDEEEEEEEEEKGEGWLGETKHLRVLWNRQPILHNDPDLALLPSLIRKMPSLKYLTLGGEQFDLASKDLIHAIASKSIPKYGSKSNGGGRRGLKGLVLASLDLPYHNTQFYGPLGRRSGGTISTLLLLSPHLEACRFDDFRSLHGQPLDFPPPSPPSTPSSSLSSSSSLMQCPHSRSRSTSRSLGHWSPNNTIKNHQKIKPSGSSFFPIHIHCYSTTPITSLALSRVVLEAKGLRKLLIPLKKNLKELFLEQSSLESIDEFESLIGELCGCSSCCCCCYHDNRDDSGKGWGNGNKCAGGGGGLRRLEVKECDFWATWLPANRISLIDTLITLPSLHHLVLLGSLSDPAPTTFNPSSPSSSSSLSSLRHLTLGVQGIRSSQIIYALKNRNLLWPQLKELKVIVGGRKCRFVDQEKDGEIVKKLCDEMGIRYCQISG